MNSSPNIDIFNFLSIFSDILFSFLKLLSLYIIWANLFNIKLIFSPVLEEHSQNNKLYSCANFWTCSVVINLYSSLSLLLPTKNICVSSDNSFFISLIQFIILLKLFLFVTSYINKIPSESL